MSDRYTVGADLGAGPDFERVVIVEQPGRVAIVCDPAEARHLAHALLDATAPEGSHWDGCWRDPRHGACAAAHAALWRARVERLEGEADEVAALLADAGYRHDQGHGPSYPPEPSEVPEIVREVLARMVAAEARAEEAEAIVRDLRRCCPRDAAEGRCMLCEVGPPSAGHAPTCPYLRARAFTEAREGREDTDHE